jgi:hypothetical protein
MSITPKEELELMLVFSFYEPIEIELAYKVYINYLNMISEADLETTDYLWRLVKQDRQGLLKVRMNFAEKGYELTPNQCEQYMFILATSLIDSIEENNEQKTDN